MTIKDEAAVVGVGATPYYKRGQSLPETQLSMACTAILAALEDAGLSVKDLDGFAIYAGSCDPAQIASVLGVPEVRFAATLTSVVVVRRVRWVWRRRRLTAGMAEVVVVVDDVAAGEPAAGGHSQVGDGGGGGGGVVVRTARLVCAAAAASRPVVA